MNNYFDSCKNSIREGFIGEEIIRQVLKDSDRVDIFFQADVVFHKKNGQWYLIECKHQEMFKKPPFDGHGLPKWQIDHRLRFQRDTGVICLLFIIEKGKKEDGKSILYYNELKYLNDNEFFDTAGGTLNVAQNKRRIFPLANFIKRVF